MIIPLVSTTLETRFGSFEQILFYDGRSEAVALVKGAIAGMENVLCRLHSSCINGHYFNSTECDCQQQLNEAQASIAAAGQGIIIYLPQEGKGNGYLALLQSKAHKLAGFSQADAYVAVGARKDARDFSAAAGILKHLGVSSVALLSNNAGKADGLREWGIQVEKAS